MATQTPGPGPVRSLVSPLQPLGQIQDIDGVPFRTCSPSQEEQATALGGTLLLPRPLLLAAANRGSDPDRIAVVYGVTTGAATRSRHRTPADA